MNRSMATRFIKEEHGVRLDFCDVSPGRSSGTGGPHYRITTRRPVSAKIRATREQAEQVWSDEVAASKLDPMVAKILAAGL